MQYKGNFDQLKEMKSVHCTYGPNAYNVLDLIVQMGTELNCKFFIQHYSPNLSRSRQNASYKQIIPRANL